MASETGLGADDVDGGDLTIKDLLSYRMHRVHSILARSAAVRFRKEYDVNLGEWRALAILAALGPMSLNQLARESDLDKGQVSRVVAGLVTREFLTREAGRSRERSRLALTPAGSKAYAGLLAIAIERNAAFMACLAPQEAAALDTALTKLEALGRALGGAAAIHPTRQNGSEAGASAGRARRAAKADDEASLAERQD